jgi:hypothetical protein
MAYGVGGAGAVPQASTFVDPVAGTRIYLRRSDTQGKKPAAGDAEYGELFVNYHSNSPMLCFKDNADQIVEIRPQAPVSSGPVPPTSNNETGDLWWDGTNLLVWNGSSWKVIGEQALGDLTDVDTAGASNGMVLSYDGAEWVPISPASLSVDVDLDYTAASDKGTVTNSAGDDAEIPLATGTNAGLSLNNYTTAEKDKLGGIEDGAEANVGTNLAFVQDKLFGTVESSTGTGATIPLGNGINAGLSQNDFTDDDHAKLDGIEDGAEANVDPTQTWTPEANHGTLVLQPGGDNTVIAIATAAEAGLMSASDKDKLDGLPDPGAITDGTVTSVDSGNGLTGGPITDAGTLSVQADGDTISVSAAGIKVTDGKFAEPGDIPDVSVYLPFAGGNMTGGVTATVRTITAGAFDLATGNLWECGGISIPNPSNAVAGMTGVIVFSAAPTSFGSDFKFPDGTPIAPSSFPAVAPFYVKGSSQILVGKAVEGIA